LHQELGYLRSNYVNSNSDEIEKGFRKIDELYERFSSINSQQDEILSILKYHQR